MQNLATSTEPEPSSPATIPAMVVQLPLGLVRVRRHAGLIQARGLRYGKARRIQAATAMPAWEGIVDATARGRVCPQLPSRLRWAVGNVSEGMAADEDCLLATVTAPEPDGTPRPVMVWLHGGGYVSGSGEAPAYDPARLVREQGVVVVNVSHRLGLFGYLDLDGVSPANLGLLDQLLALRWVRDNISAFGGDPGNVTLFGQSAGADSIYCLLVADGARGLFHRAILQSAPLGLRARSDRSVQHAVAKRARAGLAADPARMSVGDLLRLQQAIGQAAAAFGSAGTMPFKPRFGRHPLPPERAVAARLDGAARHVELLVGSNRHDALPFLFLGRRRAWPMRHAVTGAPLRVTMGGLATRQLFTQPSRHLVARWRRAGGRATAYHFEWQPADSRLGACHCIELPFLLGSVEAWWEAPMLGGASRADLEALGVDMRARWGRFARLGLPADTPLVERLGAPA